MQKRIFVCLLTILPLLLLFGMVSADFSPSHSDEFSDSATLSDWQLGPAPAATWLTMDINSSTADQLVLVPSNNNDSGGTGNNGWYQVARGPYLYKAVTGDFVATSYIVAGNVNDHSAPPSGTYNSAGFIARDSASVRSNENWVMYNIGYQTNSTGMATEAKTTLSSTSVLTLRPTGGVNAGHLTLCRSGDTFYMFKMLAGDTGWTLEETLTRSDLPTTLQVGLVVNSWTNPTLYAQFDYIRVYTGTVANSADCLTQLTTPTSVSLVGDSAETFPSNSWKLLLLMTILTLGFLWRASLYTHPNTL